MHLLLDLTRSSYAFFPHRSQTVEDGVVDVDISDSRAQCQGIKYILAEANATGRVDIELVTYFLDDSGQRRDRGFRATEMSATIV